MGRATRFLTGRRNHDSKENARHPIEWVPPSPQYAQSSKAERLLGTSLGNTSRSHSISSAHTDPYPGYRTPTTREGTQDFSPTVMSTTTMEEVFIPPPRWQSLRARASSNALGATAYDKAVSESGMTMDTRKVHGQTSSSTLRSHYDSSKSPMTVSQQTSASAVRDMGLRKGLPVLQVAVSGGNYQHHHQHHHQQYLDSPKPSTLASTLASMPEEPVERPTFEKKPKPAKLDLSKLFPKPAKNSQNQKHLLSPSKFVNSPAPLSPASDYHPTSISDRSYSYDRSPMDPPPNKLKSKRAPSSKLHNAMTPDSATSATSSRNAFDNAKVNVRRPPPGIQHWFEGLSDEDEEDEESEPTNSNARLNGNHHLAPVRKSSLGRLLNNNTPQPQPQPQKQQQQQQRQQQQSQQQPQRPQQYHHHHHHHHHSQDHHGQHQQSQHHYHSSRAIEHTYGQSKSNHLRQAPSQTSVGTTVRTMDSKLSHSNLQTSSVLSFSSSDEEDNVAPDSQVVRDSLGSTGDYDGEIIIGKAKAFRVTQRGQQRERKRPSESGFSIMSSSTSAATIDVMLSPSTRNSFVSRQRSRSTRNTHSRQPSVIPEDEYRPRSSDGQRAHEGFELERSPSPKSALSEPRQHGDQGRVMVVTEEEEALLEMMRRKRAAMAQHSFTEGYRSALQSEQTQQTRPQIPHHAISLEEMSTMSEFSADGRPLDIPAFPLPSSVHPNPASTRAMAPPPINTSMPPLSTKKSKPVIAIAVGNNYYHHDHPSESSNSRHAHPTPAPTENDLPLLQPVAYSLLPTPTFNSAPIELFHSRSQTPTTASIASPTTASHASPLPSPITPRTRGEGEILVKVAGSEPSCNGDEEASIHAPSVHEPYISGPEKVGEKVSDEKTPGPRRRTASSSASIIHGVEDAMRSEQHQKHDAEHQKQRQQLPLRGQESSSNSSSKHDLSLESLDYFPVADAAKPKRKPSRSIRTSGASTLTAGSSMPTPIRTRSSRGSQNWGHRSRDSSLMDRKESPSPALGTRCSVSDDVLAAWSSLGGFSKDFEAGRMAGM